MRRQSNGAELFVGDGEMSRLMRAFDWSATPPGPVEGWPQALRIVVRILLGSRYAMWLGWGPEFTFFYNDAYARMTLGAKHPWALGRPAREVWAEIWDDIGPRAESVVRTGKATWDERLLLFLERLGFPEETYHTFSYSPVPDDQGGVGGMLCVVTEETGRVIGERRLKTVRVLAARTSEEARSAEEACQAAAHSLAGDPHDLPFALLYLLAADDRTARLAGATGLPPGPPAAPAEVDLTAPEAPGAGWPLRAVLHSGRGEVVADVGRWLGPSPVGPYPEPPHTAVVLPLRKSGQDRLAGFLVAGASPRLPFDDDYRGFLDLLAGHVATAVANARAYEEERRRAESLAELDRAKTAFFSNVSHEFRTPLTLMLGPVEDALARPGEGEVPVARPTLALVHRNGLRLQRLVNTLLDFSRIEAGRVRASYQPTDLAAFTAELASNFRSACEKAGLALTVDCPPLAEPVFVDRAMWEKIVLNLLSNAFKFTFAGGITVSIHQDGRAAEVRVSDTGTGIPPDEMPRLFERFHRIENARGRTHEGSGIGLALVQELVRLHGGSIRAESTFGEGTTFLVSVPLGSAHLPPEQVAPDRGPAPTAAGVNPFVEEALRWLPSEEGARGEGRGASESQAGYYDDPDASGLAPRPAPLAPVPRILVADDNADMRRYIVRLLAGAYAVEVVADGAAALAAVRRRPPDLVVADVMMPRLDGFGLLRELRADPRTASLPVLLLSARAGEESRVEGLEAGADDYLVKPFSARELLARVSAHLQMARLRREAGESLRAVEERFQSFMNHSPATAYIKDGEGHYVYVNRLLEQQFGRPSAEWIGKTDLELFPPDEGRRFRENDRAVLASRQTAHFVETVTRPDGLRYYLSFKFPLQERDGGWLLAGMSIDITEQKLAEDALREADRRKDEFLATLAHELRNPLAPLRNGLQILRLSGDPAMAEPARAMMERQLEQMVRLIDDLLDLSRISRGKIELRKERVALARVIQHAVETSRPAVEDAGHDLTIALPPDDVFVDADVTRLAQVFANLLHNAAKYTERGGAIRLTVRREGGEAVVSLKDSGVGIPAAMIPRVFEMFTQVDRNLERARGGLGIGLSIVKRLVEMHGGSVEAHSEGPGKGSEFVVRVPTVESAAVPREPEDGPAARPAERRRILVVDDNRDAAASLAMMLRLMGNETQTAHDGLEALEVAPVFGPHLVLLDIGMPRLNGYDTARRIRAEPWGRDLVLVALTGWGQEEDRRRSRQAGFDDHLVKPVEPPVLEKLLAGLKRTTG